MIPTLLTAQRGLLSTFTRAIPVRVGRTVIRATPRAFVVTTRRMPGATTRTFARAKGRPFDRRTRATIVVRRPTVSCRGVTASEAQVGAGGWNTPATTVGSV